MKQLTDQQLEIVEQYQKIHQRILTLQHQMQMLKAETERLMEELNNLRKKDKQLFNYGKKE
jgi:regulator of replication initiation timing